MIPSFFLELTPKDSDLIHDFFCSTFFHLRQRKQRKAVPAIPLERSFPGMQQKNVQKRCQAYKNCCFSKSLSLEWPQSTKGQMKSEVMRKEQGFEPREP
jgi:hypothetical protein